MNINFSETDVIFMYGIFRKKVSELNKFKSTPNFSIDQSNIDADIALYTSLIDKLKNAYPNLSKVDKYKF